MVQRLLLVLLRQLRGQLQQLLLALRRLCSHVLQGSEARRERVGRAGASRRQVGHLLQKGGFRGTQPELRRRADGGSTRQLLLLADGSLRAAPG